MTDRATNSTYDGTAKSLHWLTVVLLACQYTIGWTMPHIGRNTAPARK